MSTITKEFTKEQLQQIIETDHVQCGEASALARIALASLEAEPYGYVHKAAYEQAGSCGLSSDHEAYRDSSTHIAVYTAPPAPVSVPDGYRLQPISEYDAMCAAMLQGADGKPELTVWYGAMPESNGKANWTAILHRKGEGRCMNGFTIDRSEYPGRVLYAADRVRYLIGEKSERPSILDYDADAHSGYMKTGNSPVIPDGWVACSERMPDKGQNVLISVNFDSPLIEPLICSARYTGSTFRRGDVTVKPGEGVEEVTHWMPLPAAPQQEGKW